MQNLILLPAKTILATPRELNSRLRNDQDIELISKRFSVVAAVNKSIKKISHLIKLNFNWLNYT